MKILVRDSQGNVRTLTEGFSNEEELRTFLERHADLIPLEELGGETTPLLCIGREVAVASGAQDLLYIDQLGVLTIVETKLGRNRQARREVVGQILEYAAQLSTWTAAEVERQATMFLGRPFQEVLADLSTAWRGTETSTFSYEDFLRSVEANIQTGRIRLIIATDDPPQSLVRTVEFINRSTQNLELYLLQLKKFSDPDVGQVLFVPTVLGRANAPNAARAGAGWTADGFFRQALQKAPREAIVLMEQLLDFSEREHALVWGKGLRQATFSFVPAGSTRRIPALFSVYSHGVVFIDFSTLARSNPSLPARYRDLLRSVGTLPEEVIRTETWKSFDVRLLMPDEAFDRFTAAVRTIAREFTDAGGDTTP